jgi:type IV secretion system protein VirB4
VRATRILQRQTHRLANAGDYAISQAQALRTALDAVTSNEFVMGDHHFSLQVLSDPVVGIGDTEADVVRHALAGLQAHLAQARSLLADLGITTAREDLALEAAFWAQLPGQFGLRPRKAPITSRNFAALAPFHGVGAGCAHGNHWGPSVALLATPSGTAFDFNLHVQDTGHTFVCGPTGSGKTAFIGFLITQLTRFDTTQVILDKDRGLELLVRALGGVYFPLKSGQPTGLNPLQLPPTEAHVEFLKIWLTRLVWRADRPLTVTEEFDLDQALRAVLDLPPPLRTLSHLLEFLDASAPEGVHARLSPWCASVGGDRSWLFDGLRPASGLRPALPTEEDCGLGAGSAEGGVGDRLAAVLLAEGSSSGEVPSAGPAGLVGVDVTEFLDLADVREALTLYLFHLIRQRLDGRRLVCWIDEFWRVLSDPGFRRFNGQ